MSGLGHSTYDGSPTGDARIDGILYRKAWGDASLTYSFPTLDAAPEAYHGYGAGEAKGMFAASDLMRETVHLALNPLIGLPEQAGFAVGGFTGLTVSEVFDESAQIRIAQTSEDPYGYKTAWGYYPSQSATAGDIWLTNAFFDFSGPRPGSYAFTAMIHELGHTLGLSHGHSDDYFGALPEDYDSMEYSVMTYHSHSESNALSYTNEAGGYAQSWMMLDIAALQYLYGADFAANAGDTLYQWSPDSGETLIDGVAAIAPDENRIFATIWDGNGIDTYDLSAYGTDLLIDLAPGGHSVFSKDQSAGLGDGHTASGNIYNAMLNLNDPRSLIENAIGGAGNDTIGGNQANNHLLGGAGNDTLTGMQGADHLRGQDGSDLLSGGAARDFLAGGKQQDDLSGNAGRDWLSGNFGNDRLTGGAGGDLLRGGFGADGFIFLDRTDSGTTSFTTDRIVDFQSGLDHIDLSALRDTPLEFGSEITTHLLDDRLRVDIHLDGNDTSSMFIDLLGVQSVTAADFVL